MSILQSNNLKSLVKRNNKKVLLWRYHKNLNSKAQKKIRAFSSETGSLSKTDKRLCDAYAIEVLGWKGYAPGLYLYSQRAGGFKEGWIPENYFGAHVIPRLQAGYGEVSNLRCLTHKTFKSTAHPDLGYCIHGNWYTPEDVRISETDLKKIITPVADKVVYKLDNSFQGRGIFVDAVQNMDLSAYAKMGNGVLQYFIQQHPFFNQFTNASVACIRLTTVISLIGKPELRGAFLRLGQAQDTHVQYNSELAVAINITTGALDAIGYDAKWRSQRQHADHQVSFNGLQIPSFKEIEGLVLDLHRQMPMVGIIGWDVILDEENKAVLMEWNGYGSDVAFSEATQGPCFTGLGWENFHKQSIDVQNP